jgi:hypothetical protein
MLLLLATATMNSCKQPTGPAGDEPDTAKSYVRATIVYNNMIVLPLYVRNNDTLSDGKMTRIEPDGKRTIREAAVLKSSLYALKFASNETFTWMTLGMQSLSDITTKAFRDINYRTDSLRFWKKRELSMQVLIPIDLRSGYTISINNTPPVPSVADTLRNDKKISS